MYKSKNHNKYSLKAHIVLVTKYRKPLFLKNFLVPELKLKLKNIELRSNFTIELAEVDKAHTHLMIDCEPKIRILQIVRCIKQESTFIL